MNALSAILLTFSLSLFTHLLGNNQTPTVSPIHSERELPFTVSLKVADFQLPNGLHSGVSAVHDGKWLYLAGRTNGMHGFGEGDNNFPAQLQNQRLYVIDFAQKRVWSKALDDSMAGLSQSMIDSLSVTSPQYYQSKNTLYMSGGYGITSSTGEFSTKKSFTAIDVPGLMNWVMNPTTHHLARDYIRQIEHPLVQVTGGTMTQEGDGPTLLIFGQNFTGFYLDNSNGTYTEQVRRFYVHDDGKNLSIEKLNPKPYHREPNYRRRDLNCVPIMQHKHGKAIPAYVAYSGVFTLDGGIWTVPVTITTDGTPSMQDPDAEETFKQGMNNYVSATLGLYSCKKHDMYTLIFGALSFGYFQNGEFQTDPEIPFINQITTIKIDGHGKNTQYLMNATYPTIVSSQSNPGNTLLFGAGADFFLANGVKHYSNGVVKFDDLKKGNQLMGYIVGGIQSTVPNTSNITDSAASPYIFEVYIHHK